MHVVGRECPSREIYILNHTTFIVRGQSFPGPKQNTPDACTRGLLYSRLKESDWHILDAFEDVIYERLTVSGCCEKTDPLKTPLTLFLLKSKNYFLATLGRQIGLEPMLWVNLWTVLLDFKKKIHLIPPLASSLLRI